MTDLPDDEVEVGGKGPDAFRTISEVAEELGLPQHVLRFWETRFPQVRPIKRGGGRRYYRPGDVDLLRGVKQLLYGEGYTIRGVQRILREQGGRKLAQAAGLRVEPDAAFVPSESVTAAPGPEIWAPGRRAAPVETYGETGDPEDEVDSYDDETPVVAVPSPAPVRAPERRPGLTEDQIARLQSAIGELAECRRLITERS